MPNGKNKSSSQGQEQTKPVSFEEFIDLELKRIEQARKNKMGTGDLRPFVQLKVGENVVEFVKRPPRDHPIYSGKKIFRVVKDGMEYDLVFSSNTRAYARLLQLLKQGHTKIKIIRVGTGKYDTRYFVEAAD